MRRRAGTATLVPSALLGLVVAATLASCAKPQSDATAQPSPATSTTAPASPATTGVPGSSSRASTTVVPQPSATPPQPRTIVATLHDLNRTVVLGVGEQLELALGQPARSPWTVASYPTRLLELRTQDRRSGRFVFLARAAGSGALYVRSGDVCGPPRLCPAAAGDPVDGVGGQFPIRGLRFTVVIHAR
jgi:hypothetical protein